MPAAITARFAFLTSCSEIWGGSEELWAGAARNLRAGGGTVLAIRSGGPGELSESHHRLAATGIDVASFPQTPWTRLTAGGFRRLFERWPHARQIALLAPLVRRLRAFRADLAIIAQGETYDGIHGFRNLAEACELAGVPYVIICQRASEDTWPADAARAAIKKAFTRAQRVFFVSERNRVCLERQLCLALSNAEVVRNPFMVAAANPLPWPPLEGGVARFACVARLCTRDKGQDLLLNVLARPHWRDRRLEVNFFGQGENATGLAELVQSLGLANVHFRGFTRDVGQVWRDHHALVLPSRHEGMPLTLLEAMMCGRFAIVSDVGGNTEMVDDGDTGFVFTTPTADALDDAMQRAWDRLADWESIGQRAALEVRRRVPADPCAIFAAKLVALVQPMAAAAPVPVLTEAEPLPTDAALAANRPGA